MRVAERATDSYDALALQHQHAVLDWPTAIPVHDGAADQRNHL